MSEHRHTRLNFDEELNLIDLPAEPAEPELTDELMAYLEDVE